MKVAPFLVVMGFLVAGLLPPAAGDDDSLRVVVLVEEKEYSIGTTGKVTVHVFDKGVHADPDTAPTVTIGIRPSRDISVTKKSTGVYEGTFTLQSGDSLLNYISVRATATLGKANPADTTYNEDTGTAEFLLAQGATSGMKVDCYVRSVSGNSVRPGAMIGLESKVTHNATAVVPSTIRLTATYYDRGFREHTENLDTTNPSPGVYQAVYTVPNLTQDTELSFRASAQYQGSSQSASTTLSLGFFNVIYHNISRSATTTVFDLYVADAGGKAVSGASLALSYYPDSRWAAARSLDAGPTDSKGKARLTLTFDNGTGRLQVSGYANASGVSQSFAGTIQLQEAAASAPGPHGNDFQLVLLGKDEVYIPGQTVIRDYLVFNNSKVWANKQVHAYLLFHSYVFPSSSTFTTSVEARTIPTDADGKLRLSVQIPSGKDVFVKVAFESATGVHGKPDGWSRDHESMDGLFFSEYDDDFLVSRMPPGNVLKVTVEELRLGAPTRVEASARSGDRPLAIAAWGLGEVRDLQDMPAMKSGWEAWNQLAAIMTKSGSKYSGTVNIPGCMPLDSKYTIAVILEGNAMPATEYGTASLKPGEGTAPAKGFPWPYIVAVVVLFVVVLAVVIVLRRRRAPSVAPSGTATFAGAPGVVQPPAVPPGGTASPGYTAGPQPPGQPGAPPPPPQSLPPSPQPPQPGPQQPAPQWAPPAGVQGAPGTQPAPPQYASQPAYVAAPPPSGPLPPPSRQGKVAMPNNAMCGFCNQWLLQGSTGIMCQCGKYYHEHCAKIQEKCTSCGTKLMI